MKQYPGISIPLDLGGSGYSRIRGMLGKSNGDSGSTRLVVYSAPVLFLVCSAVCWGLCWVPGDLGVSLGISRAEFESIQVDAV